MAEEIYWQHSVPFDGKFYLPGELTTRSSINMPLADAIITRRTVRKYSDEKVPYEQFLEIVELAAHAPSACNRQGWRVIYIDNISIITEIYQTGGASFLKNVKQAFLLVYNNRIDNIPYRDDIQSASAFVSFFILTAHSMGIGSCWVAQLPPKNELKRLFKISKDYDPVALVTFGYYKPTTKVLPRHRNALAISSVNEYNPLNETAQENEYTWKRKTLRSIYYNIPAPLRKKLRKYIVSHEKKFDYEQY